MSPPSNDPLDLLQVTGGHGSGHSGEDDESQYFEILLLHVGGAQESRRGDSSGEERTGKSEGVLALI